MTTSFAVNVELISRSGVPLGPPGSIATDFDEVASGMLRNQAKVTRTRRWTDRIWFECVIGLVDIDFLSSKYQRCWLAVDVDVPETC
jgi:hypothetical protein